MSETYAYASCNTFGITLQPKWTIKFKYAPVTHQIIVFANKMNGMWLPIEIGQMVNFIAMMNVLSTKDNDVSKKKKYDSAQTLEFGFSFPDNKSFSLLTYQDWLWQILEIA